MPTMNRKMIIDPRKAEPPWLQDDAGSWEQFNINYKTFASASLGTVPLDLTGYPAGAYIVGAFIRNRQNWLGGGAATATLSMGTTASATAYVGAASVFAAAPSTLPGTTLVPGTFVNATTPTASGTIRIQLVVTGGTGFTNQLTQGNADVFIWLAAMKLYFGG